MSPVVGPQLSIHLVNWSADDPGGWQHLFDRAAAADRAGIDRLVVSDHVVLGENLDAYGRPDLGGVAGGTQPTGPAGHWLEPMTLLAVIAGMTSRVRLGTSILLAALRRPVVLAKAAATLDVLSGGRLDLGVGVGWQRAEYQAAGLDFGARGDLLDHTLEVCRALWTDTPASYGSPLLSFDSVYSVPKPIDPGGVPLWISGTVNNRVARRLARFGSGWIPWGPAAADIRAGISAMAELVATNGGDMGSLQVAGALPVVRDNARRLDLERTMAGVPGLVEAGVTDFRVSLRIPRDPEEAEDFLASIVGAFREAT